MTVKNLTPRTVKNINYLRDLFSDVEVDKYLNEDSSLPGKTVEGIENCLKAMDKKAYLDNPWWTGWLNGKRREMAYYQLNEPILLVPWTEFHGAVEELLGRPVQTIEFGLRISNLKIEAEKAFKNKM